LEVGIEYARGPLFRAAFTFMVLGLLRHAMMTVWEMARIMHSAGDKKIPWQQVFVTTLKWMLPVGHIKNRLFFSLTTMCFHVSIILVPVFLVGHIALWKMSIGLSWFAIPNNLADILTIAAVVTAVLLVAERAIARASRALSRFQDYALPLVIAMPFASGFLVMHPVWNPFSFEVAMFVHVMSANIVLVLIPLTKLSHMILLPATQLVSELSWHFPPDAGSKVAVALGKENEPI